MTSASDSPMIALVRKLETVRALSRAERDAVLELPATVRSVEPSTDLAVQGDKPAHCILIQSGWLCRYKVLIEGRRQLLSFHLPGDIPDLQSLHLSIMDHNLCALTAAVVAYVPHHSLRSLTASFPNLTAALWRDSLIETAMGRELITSLGRRSSYARFAHLFCELYFRMKMIGLASDLRCQLPITQTQLGDALGVSTIHVNRVLQRLRKEGLITFRSGTLLIKDWDGLAQAAEFDPLYLHQVRDAAA